jgi:hypothetical protein
VDIVEIQFVDCDISLEGDDPVNQLAGSAVQ